LTFSFLCAAKLGQKTPKPAGWADAAGGPDGSDEQVKGSSLAADLPVL
jgi:hypothetical protein